jgi:tripartite-type tricarboxylate transporter receptor subunit TctC
MPGAGGLLATNFLYTQAPQDGTTIGLIHSTVPLAPLFGMAGARFDPLKIHWIGSMDRSDGPCTAWHTSPIKNWRDMLEKEFIVGSSGVGSQMELYPVVMNRLFGTKVKVIGGYKDGASIFHAMEREEIHGRCGPQLTSIGSLRPQWLTEKKISVPVVVSERRTPQFPDAPTLIELAKDEPTRQQIRLLIVSQDLDRPVLAPPGVPAERVKLLRDAFNATMTDPAFLADIKKQRLTLDWVSGEDVTKTLAAAYAMPPDVVSAAKSMMAGK